MAIITESFLPQVNGVTNSVRRVLEHLDRRGHEALVVAPGAGSDVHEGTAVVRTRAVALPMYRSHRVGVPRTRRIEPVLRTFSPDIVHLASPVVLGACAAAITASLALPSVAVYQTDIAGYARRYRLGLAQRSIWNWLRRIHASCSRTLAPSSQALWDLRRNGIPDVHLWGRGVDHERFSPEHRSTALRRRLAPEGEVLVGYVGRLAVEKRLHLLAPLAEEPGVRLVLAGDGPLRRSLKRHLPTATFLGFQEGRALSEVFASLDVFVHTGADETFCQSAQEALASGVPVVAPAAGGLLDLVRDGKNGLLWLPDEPAALVSAVRALVADEPTRRAMSAEARASVAGRTWEALGDELLGHYEAVIERGMDTEAVA